MRHDLDAYVKATSFATAPAATRAAVSRADARSENITGVTEPVLLHACKVGVTGPNLR